MNSIFEYNDYKVYLRQELRKSRGQRSQLASAIHCHNGYVSQVLNGAADFSLEQGELISRFLGHTKEQANFFLLLIQKGRAGSVTLRKHFEEQLKILVEKQFVLKDRLQFKRSLTREDQAIFYSSWHYGAIHVLVSIPACNSSKGISEYLGVSIERVNEVLEFLLSVGLVIVRDDRYEIGTTHIHLESDSPMISKHHTNWRLKAMQSLDRLESTDLHYSSVITGSIEDSVKIREILVKAIEDIRAIVRTSPNEAGFAYALDFFGLDRPQ